MPNGTYMLAKEASLEFLSNLISYVVSALLVPQAHLDKVTGYDKKQTDLPPL